MTKASSTATITGSTALQCICRQRTLLTDDLLIIFLALAETTFKLILVTAAVVSFLSSSFKHENIGQ